MLNATARRLNFHQDGAAGTKQLAATREECGSVPADADIAVHEQDVLPPAEGRSAGKDVL